MNLTEIHWLGVVFLVAGYSILGWEYRALQINPVAIGCFFLILASISLFWK